MENSKYKVLVLLDLKENSHEIVEYCAELNKEIDADFHLFHVIKATDIVTTDSQLSAMRTMNREYLLTKNTIKELAKRIAQEHGIHMTSSVALGNVRHEIDNCVSTIDPDVIVIGKPKQKPIKILGESTRKHVLKKYKGMVLVASTSISALTLKDELPETVRR